MCCKADCIEKWYVILLTVTSIKAVKCVLPLLFDSPSYIIVAWCNWHNNWHCNINVWNNLEAIIFLTTTTTFIVVTTYLLGRKEISPKHSVLLSHRMDVFVPKKKIWVVNEVQSVYSLFITEHRLFFWLLPKFYHEVTGLNAGTSCKQAAFYMMLNNCSCWFARIK